MARNLLVVLLIAAVAVLAVLYPPCQSPDDSAPLDVLVDRELGEALFAEERYEEAEQALERVLNWGGATAQDHVNLACVELARMPLDEEARRRLQNRARELLNTASEMDPNLASVWYCHGVLARREDNNEDARRFFAQSVALVPDDPAALVQLASTLKDLDLDEESEVALREILSRGVEFGGSFYASAVYRLSHALIRSQDPARVEEGKLLQARFRELEEGGIKGPTRRELDRGILGVVRVPGPTQTAGHQARGDSLSFDLVGDAVFQEAGVLGDVISTDLNGDGRIDLVAAGAEGVTVALASDDGHFEEQLLTGGGNSFSSKLAAGDLDQDGQSSLVILGEEGVRLLTPADGQWRDDSHTLPDNMAATDVLFVDHDHEGDLDLLLATRNGLRLFRNDGSEKDGDAVQFTEVTEQSGLGDQPFSSVLILDADSDQDIDILASGKDVATVLFSNLRQGRFEAKGSDVTGIPDRLADIRALDLDHNGETDLVLVDRTISIMSGHGDGTYEDARPLVGAVAEGDVFTADFDLNGEQDFLVSGSDAASVYLGSLLHEPTGNKPQGLSLDGTIAAVTDMDGDGDLDLIVKADDGVRVARGENAPGTHSLVISLRGRKDNRQGVGTTVEVRAGPLYQHFLVNSSEVNPLVIGLGGASRADIVRVTWPNGVIQYAILPDSDLALKILQKEGLVGSCPFLYTWNGEHYRFISDVLGATPLGLPAEEGVYVVPNHEELVRLEEADLVPKNGSYEVLLTEELREVTYLDRVQLWVVDHPENVEVHPEERFCFPPFPIRIVHALKEPEPIIRAIGSDGIDWTEALQKIDRDHAVPFEPAPSQFLGLATPHHIDLTLPEKAATAKRVRLMLTGWFFWTDASVNIASGHDPRQAFIPPTFSVPDGSGGWKVTGPPVGFPTGKTKTMVVDITDILNRDDPRIRVSSTLRLYWNAARVALDDGDHAISIRRIEPATADLRYRGFSQPQPPIDPEQPELFNYESLRPPPWNQHQGFLTRYGDVLPLVTAVDDRFALFAAGDELCVRFDATGMDSPDGMARTYLLFLDGWAKDNDHNTATGGLVDPLPFHGMSSYPPPPGEQCADPDARREYIREWNIRPGRTLIEDLATDS